ncbi:transglycosylase domain-containing protein [Spongiibacter taiwanensis]|uniref:transglycosylase domain-containing protein n=1 Tax=Spongiibacter taiwanensis TaxID=1748242 RepID=UPI002035F4D4|nr:transglycosylase domain-containing protein [Spongiibacter taiwanensis]USA42027.1 transglycosylase domain-containing protein [Spongiibacter taiwanensis]
MANWRVIRNVSGGLLLAVTLLVVAVGAFEFHTSYFQARYFSELAAKLQFEVKEGPSDAIRFPGHGPYNIQNGYTRLPAFSDRLTGRSFQIAQQSRFSPALIDYMEWGGNPPYPVKAQSGLVISDRDGDTLFSAKEPESIYRAFDDIPPLLLNSLLFIENRELLGDHHPRKNPVVEWDRLAEAALYRLPFIAEPGESGPGGSTLATQMEKFRYSPRGLTTDSYEKLRQIVSGSVRYYAMGTDTREARRIIVRDYLNATPLSGRPGRGEIHGVGDGLKYWYGIDFAYANRVLSAPYGIVDINEQARVFKSALSLLLSQRRPSYYLLAGRPALEELTARYLRVLAKNGVIDEALRNAALAQPLSFAQGSAIPPPPVFVSRKAVNNVRTELLKLLGVDSLYLLDRLDLTADTTIDGEAQAKVEALLQQVTDLNYAKQSGLLGEKLLRENQLDALDYSVLLYESTPSGNVLRVQTDNLNMPFDMNTGSKLDLGSTAKLRTLISYLEIIEKVYLNHRALAKDELSQARKLAEDPLRQWTLDYLIQRPDADLKGLLEAAMQRRYSASPAEAFFTASGLHRFSNFDRADNFRVMSVGEAMTRSVNLVFIRMMRDIARYYTLEIPGYKQLLLDREDPRRKDYLKRFADMEGKTFLNQFYRVYTNLDKAQLLTRLASRTKPFPGRLSMAFRSVQPEASPEELTAFLQARLPPALMEEADVAKLYRQFDPGRFDSNDRAYLARLNPLELFVVKYLLDKPGATLSEIYRDSEAARQEAYAWLNKSRKVRAQDSRIRILLEQDAFRSIHQQWQRLGYPFESLIPSFATALGASADRPIALAELMGIIVNNGVRKPFRQIDSLHFAEDTPYQTDFSYVSRNGQPVLSTEICQTVRSALANIVEVGTARRLKGVYVDADGKPIAVGGKTGTGDHRVKSYAAGGRLVGESAVNRNALFTFYIGDRFFGVILAHVGGQESGGFEFTSGLAAQLLKILQPALTPMLLDSRDAAPAPAPQPVEASPPTAALAPTLDAVRPSQAQPGTAPAQLPLSHPTAQPGTLVL